MKLQLLPKAEWIPSDELSSQGPVFTEKGMGFNIPTKVFLVLFISMFPLFFLLPVIAMFVFGLICILAGLKNTGRLKSNGKITKNTLWSRTPYIMAGLFIIIIGITTFFELKDDKKGDVVFFGCMKVLLAIIALLLIGRAVFLIVTAAAISARKKRCTEAVLAELTGMEVSNASVYDGATAAAEGVSMCRSRKRSVTLVSAAAHPDVIATIKTYLYGVGAEMKLVPAKDGKTDVAALKELLAEDVASLYFAQPNFFGQLEDSEALIAAAHEAGAMVVMGCNPISLAVLKSPGELGADVAVGEGQPLGMPLAYGGPYLGFMATTKKNMRSLPGRIVGETTDDKGNRAFVLSLQAREQHIRREKASSNICSNEALCALTAGLYMATMGPEGLKDAANQSVAKAHYLAYELAKLPGVKLTHQGDFFHEFVTALPRQEEVLAKLESAGILGGLPVEAGLLWCVTEKASKADLDEVVSLVKEVLA